MTIKAHQRIIRERKATGSDNLFGNTIWENIDVSIDKSEIREISWNSASSVILDYEWLGNMGSTEFAYGIFWENHLAGAVCFGKTAGTNVNASVCGIQYANHVITLCRGACVHWAHKHAASKLISSACRMMMDHGFNIFVAYSDPEAGEIGTVYQASNWIYCGMTSATEKFVAPDGSIKDSRLVSSYSRDRRGGTLKYWCTRAEQKARMLNMGYRFFKGGKKHRYVRIVARSTKEEKQMRSSMQWPILPYPKRIAAEVSGVTRDGSTVESEVQSLDAAQSFSLQT